MFHVLNQNDNFFRLVVISAFLYVLVAANYSVGYFGYDEHVQILEAAKVKLDGGDVKNVAWDYKEELRPSIQPLLAVSVFEGLSFFGVDNAHSRAFFLRLFTGWFSVVVIAFLIHKLKDLIDAKDFRLFCFLSFFLWFIPFHSVRFSSETMGSLFFLLGFSFILSANKRLLIAGVLFGLSFLFRYQIGVMVFGLVCWLIFIERLPWKRLVELFMGIGLSVVFGIVLDSLFYGDVTWSLWHYFRVNILSGLMQNAGPLPWYFYLLWTVKQSVFPLGIIIIGGLLLFVSRHLKNPITWTILPFIIFHSVIPHKEVRYIVPLVYFLPFILIKTNRLIIDWLKNHKILKLGWLSLVFAVMMLNFGVMLISTTKPCGDGTVRIGELVEGESKGETEVFYLGKATSLKLFPFYQNDSTIYKNVLNVNSISRDSSLNQFIVIDKNDFKNNEELFLRFKLASEYTLYPPWLEYLNSHFDVDNRGVNYTVLRML